MSQSELKRGTIRILSNYARLVALVFCGILFVPIFLYGVGIEAFGILGLLGASVGIAEMCKSIVRQSMIRELGAAYHSDDPEEFPRAYNSAIVLSAAAAFLAVALYGGIFLLLPVLDIPPHLLEAAKWLLLAKGLLSVFVVITSPQFNMYRITERMISYNLWITLSRTMDLLSAVFLFLILGIRDPGDGLKFFGFLSVGSSGAVVLIAVALMFRLEPRMWPSLSVVNRASLRDLLSTSGWNSLVVTAISLHIRLDQFIMNFAFGAVGNAIFTLGLRLTSYVWQVAGAATDGLDAVSARISSNDRDRRGIATMLYHTTRLQAVITLPASLAVIVLADPFMVLWVGRTTDDPTVIPKAVVIAQVLTVGMIAKGISQVWMRILYGAGHVRTYGPVILCGGLLNPVIALLLIYLLPPSVNYLGPAIAFASIFMIFHFLFLPMLTARCMDITLQEVLGPLVKPLIATVISGPALFIPHAIGLPHSPLALIASIALYGCIWATLCWWYVLSADDRKRLSDGVRRRFPRPAKGQAPPREPIQPQPVPESAHQWGVGDELDGEDEIPDLPPRAP